MIWMLLAALVAVLIAYVFWGREYMRVHYGAWRKFLEWIEPYETFLWDKSRTIFVGRFYWVAGLVVGVHDAVATFVAQSGVSLTPIVGRLLAVLPADVQPLALPALMYGTGLLINWLRKRTDEPLQDKV